jgi:hypothetical protein
MVSSRMGLDSTPGNNGHVRSRLKNEHGGHGIAMTFVHSRIWRPLRSTLDPISRTVQRYIEAAKRATLPGPGPKSRHGDRRSWRIFAIFLSHPRWIRDPHGNRTFWVEQPRNSEISRRFGKIYGLYLQGISELQPRGSCSHLRWTDHMQILTIGDPAETDFGLPVDILRSLISSAVNWGLTSQY